MQFGEDNWFLYSLIWLKIVAFERESKVKKQLERIDTTFAEFID